MGGLEARRLDALSKRREADIQRMVSFELAQRQRAQEIEEARLKEVVRAHEAAKEREKYMQRQANEKAKREEAMLKAEQEKEAEDERRRKQQVGEPTPCLAADRMPPLVPSCGRSLPPLAATVVHCRCTHL